MAKTNGSMNNLPTVTTPVAVAGVGGLGWTTSFVCEKNVTYSFEYQFDSAGVVACSIELEQGNIAPATEGAVSLDMVVPEDAAVFDANVGDKLNHIKAYAPAATNFLRAKITGLGTNAASTTLTKFIVTTEVNL